MTAANPVHYESSVEQPSDGEEQAIADLRNSFDHILGQTSKDYGRAVRAVHAKGHGILRGSLTVHDGLGVNLAQGLFAKSGNYEAILRFSTSPGDILDDAVSAPRGAALKVLGVSGPFLDGAEQDGAQDFLMVNGPVFGAPTPKAFAKNLKLLAGTTDKAEGAKAALSATLRVVEGAIEAVGLKSALITQLGGAPEVHPLGETYYSQAAFRYGDHIAKFALVPISGALTELTGDKINVHDRPNALREVVREVMIEQGGIWELRVQLCTDLDKMPVEDPTVEWDENASPYATVATLRIEPQTAWTNGTSEGQEDRLSFSPWHGLAAHQPLGAINRARRAMYDFSAHYRADFNACPVHSVKALSDLVE